ncbi:hypothetical protein [Streptomyces sp. NBC_00582]|uniref:hypothetical protein n=1 Tax=Streptomyces sp. NBC_00582 TaxID=2975783 RepID=UPI001062CE7C|nr:hypothetical protein [Streptomyces sp. NBC_00582]WUB62268.1 hypothetical protein OG852_18650 [Streptomyces sp. NBC_00582]
MSTDTLTDLDTGRVANAVADEGGWRIATASVVLLAVGVLTAYGFNVFEDRHAGAELDACRTLPNTWPMYTAAVAGLLATVASVALAGRRLLLPRRPRGPVQMAGMVLPAGVLLLVLQAMIVWSVFQPSSGGALDCLR